jgi:hypothetical protein
VPSGRVSACIHTVENNHRSGPKAPFEFEKKNASHSRAKHLLSEGSNLSARLPVRRFNSPNAARATEILASRAQADLGYSLLSHHTTASQSVGLYVIRL